MRNSQASSSHFLDKQTFFAVVLIFLSWILWERHMQKKYKKTTVPIVQQEQLEQKKEEPKIKTVLKQQLKQEEFVNFKNSLWELQFSSRGMGISGVHLKKFLNRDKKIVYLKPADSFLFFEIQAQNQPVSFNIRKEKENFFKGVAHLSQTELVVTMQIESYFIEYEIVLKGQNRPSIQVISVNKPKKGASGFIQGLLLGAEPGLSLFAKNVKTTERVFYTNQEQKESLTLPQIEMIGIGSRYFGQAFFNQSDLLPQLQFEGEAQYWKSQLHFNIPPQGQLSSIKYKVFFGPKSMEVLQQVQPQLVQWINFGFLSWLAKAILVFLKLTFSLTHNWGFSIILLTVLVRILLFPLNFSAYRSMAVMKKIQPEMKNLRQQYKENPKKMNEEVLALMKRNKARPLGGCLPMLLQFPIFFALYRVLGESFELYQAPFFGWIQDLSIKDPYYVLPVLMGFSMYIQQKITPTNMDPTQEKVLKFLPIIFTFFMINLPSGLTLYIFISTAFGLVQQYYFTKTDNTEKLQIKNTTSFGKKQKKKQ